MKGELPKKEDEIAIDRMYAENNKIQISDIIKVGKEEKTVTGYVALSDYSALFSNNSDMMFDAVKFGVAIVTDEAFDNLEETHLKYRYSWTYDDPPQGEKAEKERSDDFLEILADYTSVTGYIPRYANQAIHFTGDDMGSDRSMMIVLLYILIAHGLCFCGDNKQYDCQRGCGDRNPAGFRLYKKRTSGTLHDTAASGHDYSSGDRKCSGLYRL